MSSKQKKKSSNCCAVLICQHLVWIEKLHFHKLIDHNERSTRSIENLVFASICIYIHKTHSHAFNIHGTFNRILDVICDDFGSVAANEWSKLCNLLFFSSWIFNILSGKKTSKINVAHNFINGAKINYTHIEFSIKIALRKKSIDDVLYNEHIMEIITSTIWSIDRLFHISHSVSNNKII